MCNIHVIGIPKGEERVDREICKIIVIETFPKLVTDTKL